MRSGRIEAFRVQWRPEDPPSARSGILRPERRRAFRSGRGLADARRPCLAHDLHDLPTAPGLGLDIYEAALAQRRVEPPGT
jgi:hypothetical protein